MSLPKETQRSPKVAPSLSPGVAPSPSPGVAGTPDAVAASGRLDLRPFFAYSGRYAVLRLPAEFPAYREYSDLDVLCDDIEALRAHIESCAAPYLARGFRLEAHRDGSHLHLDFFCPGGRRLDVRFDLCASVPALYPKVGVDPELTAVVLEERHSIEREGAAVWVPSVRHELALRFLEYLEWHERRPDKKKHLDYIERANDFSFLDVINAYTGLWAQLETGNGQATIDLRAKTQSERADLAAVRAHLPRRQRFDYFMIWGHGLSHAEEMLATIREHPAFRILTVVKRRVDDIARFVQRVYEADTVPMQHLVAKTRYLLTTPPEILFVLVLNLDPQEQYFGEGAFRHIQCRQVKAVKEELRNRFNPRQGGKRTEDHVIHGSDYESQVRHLLTVLGLPPPAHYVREPNPRIRAPYYIPAFERFQIIDVPLADLRARILGNGDIPLAETPHAQYLAGDVQAYIDYHDAHMGRELTDDHFAGAFERLRRSFEPDRTERDGKLDLILAVPMAGRTYRIIDGVHRAALLLHLGRTQTRIAVPEWTPQR